MAYQKQCNNVLHSTKTKKKQNVNKQIGKTAPPPQSLCTHYGKILRRHLTEKSDHHFLQEQNGFCGICYVEKKD